MARELNHRLTSTDAAFLYVEKPSEAMSIGGCLVYDGHIPAAEVFRVMSQRMHELPRYRQRVVFPPFGVAHPTWEDDPEFDLVNHIEETTLPAPADELTMTRVGGEFYAEPLDRRHPLWKVVLLQGRPDGNTAMVWKIHHAMVDGVSGVELTMVLHDLRPEGDARPPSPGPWTPPPLPDPVVQIQQGVRDRLVEFAQQWTDIAFRLLRPRPWDDRDRRLATALLVEAPRLAQPAPPTPFNAPLSGERDFGWIELPFAEIRQIKNVLGGTVNDAVLAIIAGGLGKYLRAHGYPTDVALRAMCPVSLRPPEAQAALGNLVSMVIAPLYVGVTDPVHRLFAQRRAMEELKGQQQAESFRELSTLTNLLPPAWQALGGQLQASTTILNTVTTNIPGPQVPLYLAGRKLMHWYPLGPLSSTVGLFNSILTYNHVLTIGTTVDPTLVPDVWKYIGFLRESFMELRGAAGVGDITQPAPVPASATVAA